MSTPDFPDVNATGASGPGMTSDESDHIEERFASLGDASRNLASDVQALTSAISTISALQERQRELAEKQDAQETALYEQQIEQVELDNRVRGRVRKATIGFAIILPIGAIVVYLVLIAHVNDLINQNNKAAYASCSARNESQLQNAIRESTLAQYETNPKIKAVHQTSAQQLRTTLSDCSRWKK